MKRTGPIKRNVEKIRAWLSERSPIKKKKRSAVTYEEQFGPPGFADHVYSRGCVVAAWTGTTKGCLGPLQFCHYKTRAAFGGWRNNSFCACMGHHGEQHDKGILTFQKIHGLDLELECDATTHTFDRKQNGW